MRSTIPLLVLLAACQAEDEAGLDLVDTEAYRDQEVLVAVDDGSDAVSAMLLAEEYGFEELESNDAIGVVRMGLPDGMAVRDAVGLLGDDWRVRYAEPNYLVRAAATPNDPYVAYQWHLDAVGAMDAWDVGGRGSGVVVAVLDTGVRSGGPDGITHLLSGWDFYSGDSDPTDYQGHGTFVAGTIGQATDNGVGGAGVAPEVSILPVKVMSDQGYGDISAIARGITWAADQGADVINMSLGSPYYSQTLADAAAYAYGKGVVLVAASGNEYASSVDYPAALDTVIAVGATRYDGTRAAYSNYGSGLELVAPGGDLSRDQNGDGYADGILQETFDNRGWTWPFWEGTSMAAPQVAAAAALVVAQGDFTPDEVRAILRDSAQDVGSPGYDTQTGYGLVDAAAAVQLALDGGASSGGGTDTGGSAGGDGGGSSGGTDTGTAGGTEDTTPPVISGVSGYVQGANFTITWTTDEPADSYITFEGYGTYGDGALTTSHALQFRGRRGASYTFTIESTDAAGNTATDGPWVISL